MSYRQGNSYKYNVIDDDTMIQPGNYAGGFQDSFRKEQSWNQDYQNGKQSYNLNGYKPPMDNNIGDIDVPSPRGEDHTMIINYATTHLLRVGLIIQILALILMQIIYKIYGGSGLFIFDVYMIHDVSKMYKGLHLSLIILTLFNIYGLLLLLLFQSFLPDNSKLSRGYRIGSKLFSVAITIDLISYCLRLAQYYYAYSFMTLKWWAKYTQSAGDWSLLQLGNMLNAASLVLLGTAFFYMETYHDEGSDERFGWILLVLFIITGISEFLMIFTSIGSWFSLLQIISLVFSLWWAFYYEPLILLYSPPLHSRDLNTDMVPENRPEIPYGYYDLSKPIQQINLPNYTANNNIQESYPNMISQKKNIFK